MCEISDIRTEPWGYQAAEILELLHRYGYLWYSAEQNGTLQPYISREYYNWENAIAIPKEKSNQSVEKMLGSRRKIAYENQGVTAVIVKPTCRVQRKITNPVFQ